MSLVPNRPTRMARPARRPRTADGDPSGLLRNVPPPQVRWPRASGGAREGRQGRRNDTARVEDESPGDDVDPGTFPPLSRYGSMGRMTDQAKTAVSPIRTAVRMIRTTVNRFSVFVSAMRVFVRWIKTCVNHRAIGSPGLTISVTFIVGLL